MTRRTIVLWDIDNTLLYTGGAGSLGMARAFRDLYGIEDAFRRVEFSGRTDSAILRDAMLEHGLPTDDFETHRDRFLDAYIPHLAETLQEVAGGRLMPGIGEVLQALSARDDVVMGLGTGNFRRGGELKIRHYEIDAYFPAVDGGFGEDSLDRAVLVARGIERLRGANGHADRVVIIGDTPHDVTAAKANGAFALAVATGRNGVEELRGCGADAALDDLSDVERVVGIITSG